MSTRNIKGLQFLSVAELISDFVSWIWCRRCCEKERILHENVCESETRVRFVRISCLWTCWSVPLRQCWHSDEAKPALKSKRSRSEVRTFDLTTGQINCYFSPFWSVTVVFSTTIQDSLLWIRPEKCRSHFIDAFSVWQPSYYDMFYM